MVLGEIISFLLSAVLHVGLIVAAISIVYFTIGIQMIKNVLNREISRILIDIIKPFKGKIFKLKQSHDVLLNTLLTKTGSQSIGYNVKALENKYYSGLYNSLMANTNTPAASSSNNKIKLKTLIYSAIIVGASVYIFSVGTFLAYSFNLLTLKEVFSLIIESILLTGLVVISEVCFITYIGSNYRPIDIDAIRKKIINGPQTPHLPTINSQPIVTPTFYTDTIPLKLNCTALYSDIMQTYQGKLNGNTCAPYGPSLVGEHCSYENTIFGTFDGFNCIQTNGSSCINSNGDWGFWDNINKKCLL